MGASQRAQAQGGTVGERAWKRRDYIGHITYGNGNMTPAGMRPAVRGSELACASRRCRRRPYRQLLGGTPLAVLRDLQLPAESLVVVLEALVELQGRDREGREERGGVRRMVG